MRVDLGNFDAGGALAATPFSPATVPEPPAPDNDVGNDDNGARVLGQPAFSGAITLADGTEPGGDANNTLDFGFRANTPGGAERRLHHCRERGAQRHVFADNGSGPTATPMTTRSHRGGRQCRRRQQHDLARLGGAADGQRQRHLHLRPKRRLRRLPTPARALRNFRGDSFTYS